MRKLMMGILLCFLFLGRSFAQQDLSVGYMRSHAEKYMIDKIYAEIYNKIFIKNLSNSQKDELILETNRMLNKKLIKNEINKISMRDVINIKDYLKDDLKNIINNILNNDFRFIKLDPTINEFLTQEQIKHPDIGKSILEKGGIPRFEDIQKLDEYINKDLRKEEEKETIPDLLNKGYIELFSNGQTKGAAQLFKIRIGEPSLYGMYRFSVPFYVYVGAKGNSLASEKTDTKKEEAFNDLLDPLGGIINFHIADTLPFDIAISKFGMSAIRPYYQMGAKLMNVEDQQTKNNEVFINFYGSLGLSFQTAAWEEKSENNMGLCWAQIRILATVLSKDRLKQIFNDESINSFMPGIAGEIGLLINNRINFKVGYYQLFLKKANNPALDYLDKAVVKITLDYSGKTEKAEK